MILEGLVTTLNPDSQVNVAPMGPIIDEVGLVLGGSLLLRPFQSSTTYRNLQRTGHGIFHIHDDVLLFAQSALSHNFPPPSTVPAQRVSGRVLCDCCRWYEFEVLSLDDSRERTEIQVQIVHLGWFRDFIGFHRARHAVLEATILATRIHLLGKDQVLTELRHLASAVEKTAGARETEAFELVRRFVESA